MNLRKKRILAIVFLLNFFSVSFSQTADGDSLRGSFTYLMQYKPNTLSPDYVIKELYSLQISDKRAFLLVKIN